MEKSILEPIEEYEENFLPLSKNSTFDKIGSANVIERTNNMTI